MKETDWCEKLSALLPFPHARPLDFPNIGQNQSEQIAGQTLNPFRSDESRHIERCGIGWSCAPVQSSAGYRSNLHWVTGSQTGLSAADHISPQQTFLLSPTDVFCGLEGGGRGCPMISRLFCPHIFSTVCEGRWPETCHAPDSEQLSGLRVVGLVVSLRWWWPGQKVAMARRLGTLLPSGGTTTDGSAATGGESSSNFGLFPPR